jgi:hypothetical protein
MITTRLTNEARDKILQAIMQNLPNENLLKQLHCLIQEEVLKVVPEFVRTVYNVPASRPFLRITELCVSNGNKSLPLWEDDNTRTIIGWGGTFLQIRTDDAVYAAMAKDTYIYAVTTAVRESRLVEKYFDQKGLHDSVKKRLKSNLQSVTTYKKLYEVLEPELHHYIPKDEVKAQVPACVAPVVDDLRKLGAVLPETPKAMGAKE